MADGQYSFSIALDDKELKLGAAAAKKAFAELVEAARKAGVEIDESFENPFDNLDTAGAERAFTDFVKKAQEAGVKVDEVFEKVFDSIPEQMPQNPFTAITPPSNLPEQTMAAAQSFNGLNMATQSLIRELPSATIGLNTFFMAISNNLPIFADQIKSASKANKELAAQGRPTVSVFSQIIKSLFSWQTALMLGVTALSMYGKEIGNWISNILSGKGALDSATKAQDNLNKKIEESGFGIGDEIVKLKELQIEYKELGGAISEQEKFIRDNQSAFNDLGVSIRDVVDADKLFIDQTDDFVESLRLRAQAAAARTLAEEAYEDAARLDVEIADAKKEGKTFWDTTKANLANLVASQSGEFNAVYGHNTTGTDVKNQRIKALEEQRNEALQLADSYFDIMRQKEGEADAILDDMGLETATNDKKIKDTQETQFKEHSKRMQQLEYDSQQAIIDMMAEGTDKKLAQLDLDHKKRMDAIAEQEAELLAKQGTLTKEQAAMFKNIRAGAANDYVNAANEALLGDTDEAAKVAFDKLKADEKAWEDYIIAYGTFQERLLGTAHKYNRLIAEAETEGERMALEAERDAILAEYEVQASGWAKELVDKTTEQLNAMIEELQAQVDAKQAAFDALDSSDSTTAQQYREEINKLNAQIKILQELLNKANKAVKDDNWADATQVFQNISQAANDAAEGIEEFDEGLATALRGIANLSSTATNMIGAIKGVMTAFAEGAKGIEKASAILAVVGAAIQAVSVLISLFKGSDEVEQTMRQFKELNAELEHFRKLAQIDSVEGTIFGEDAFGNFSNNLRVMREALDELNESKNKIRDYRLDYWAENVWGGAYASGAKYDSFEEALANMTVKTRDRSGFAEFFGATDEYAKLGSLYPELFAGGEVTLEGLQKLKESDVWEKLSQANRDLIDELIDDWERYDKATKAVTDYLKGIFGELGQEINDAIVDAFANGTDAAVAFGDVAGKMLENLISQIGYTAYIAPILSKAMADVEALNGQNLSAEDYLNALMGIVGDTMKAAEDAVDGYNEFLERSDRMAEEQGISTFNGERTAAAKGSVQATQDSIDELSGRATAIQSHTSMLVDGQKQLINDSAQALTYLAGIESNTAHLEQMRLDMSAMHKDMSAMRKDISDMATRGIVTR